MEEDSIVLNFYKKLPFNIKENFLRNNHNINFYHPDIYKIALKHRNVIDIGCGPGHLINNINLQLNKFPLKIGRIGKINCKGIDFNPTAILYALKYSNKYCLSTDFMVKSVFDLKEKDLFCKNKSLFVMSNGALHHTENCLSAIEIILKKASSSNKKISFLIGLYHLYGRKPFLDHFNNLKKEKKSEDFLRREFHSLRGLSTDKLNNESWFQDQVNHPLETQHTLGEIFPLFSKYKFELINTSLDKFSGSRIDEILKNEKNQYDLGINALKDRRYFPGYFTCLFSKEN